MNVFGLFRVLLLQVVVSSPKAEQIKSGYFDVGKGHPVGLHVWRASTLKGIYFRGTSIDLPETKSRMVFLSLGGWFDGFVGPCFVEPIETSQRFYRPIQDRNKPQIRALRSMLEPTLLGHLNRSALELGSATDIPRAVFLFNHSGIPCIGLLVGIAKGDNSLDSGITFMLEDSTEVKILKSEGKAILKL